MTPDTSRQNAEATRRFERELNHLLMESFASGVTIERTWEITIPVADAPNWRVQIEKTYTDGEPPFEPDLLDE